MRGGYVLLGLLVGACCFGGGGRAPTADVPQPPYIPSPATVEFLEEQAASEELTTPEHLDAAGALLDAPTFTAEARGQARGHLDAIPEGEERARVRALRRRLTTRERELEDGLLDEADAFARAGDAPTAHAKLALVPETDRTRRRIRAIQREIGAQEGHRVTRGDIPRMSGTTPYCVHRYLRATAHDPGSISIVGCGRLSAIGDDWVIDCSYRGANAFGATVLNSTRFFIRHDDVVRTGRVR